MLVTGQRMDELRQLASGLRRQARLARQRRLLVLAGEAAWCRQGAAFLCSAESDLEQAASWISASAPAGIESLPGRQALALLGRERETLVFDAHSGFDPDIFGAVSGALVGGGLLILLCPPLAEWPARPDPAAARIAVAPFGYAEIGGRFLRRLVACLKGVLDAAQGAVLVTPHGPLPTLPPDPSAAPPLATDGECLGEEQAAAVAAVVHVVHGHRRRPLVLEADRGRGKSAALGIAAARLLRGGLARITVTAPRRSAVEPLFAHAERLLPGAHREDGSLCWHDARIDFLPPDELLRTPHETGLLLVDEAAAIPVPLLEALLRRHSRCAFATTVHGYEGTGRGFALRFRQSLDRLSPGWRALHLSQPIRWAAGDPLERFVFRALLLDAEAATPPSDISPADCRCERLDRDSLGEDEATLSPLFGLLLLAHYRTRPNDLRNLLDGPGLRVYVLRHRGVLVACALVASEGGFDAAMADDIFAARRRPQGHLIAQSLACHLGLAQGPRLRCARVMRIAVHPAVQRRGLGRRLLAQVREAAERQGYDLLGASFGATEDLLHFWAGAGLRPVRLGFTRDHASGCHAALLLRPLSEAGAALVDRARRLFLRDLPLLLAGPLRELPPPLVCRLLSDAGADWPSPSAHDGAQARQFAAGAREAGDVLGALQRLLLQRLAGHAGTASADLALLVAAVLQQRAWTELAAWAALPGRAAVLARLRQAVTAELLPPAASDAQG